MTTKTIFLATKGREGGDSENKDDSEFNLSMEHS